MNIGYLQFRPAFGDTNANIDALIKLIPSSGADLLVLPELATSGYTFTSKEELASLAEPFKSSPSLARLQDIAAQRECALVVGFPELGDDGSVYNASALLRPDGTRELYRKIHLFGTERLFFTPGDRPFEVHDLSGVKIGMMICFDWYFPESARILALKGAQIICQPANLVLQWCQRAMVIRGVENRVFTVTANRYGTEERGKYAFTFTGASQITTPAGDQLSPAQDSGDMVSVVEIDPSLALHKNVTELSNLFDGRRPEFYHPICSSNNDTNKV